MRREATIFGRRASNHSAPLACRPLVCHRVPHRIPSHAKTARTPHDDSQLHTFPPNEASRAPARWISGGGRGGTADEQLVNAAKGPLVRWERLPAPRRSAAPRAARCQCDAQSRRCSRCSWPPERRSERNPPLTLLRRDMLPGMRKRSHRPQR